MRLTLHADGRAESGGSALVMHNERLADPLDEIVREISAITSRRKKTEADHLEIARLEWLGGLYTDRLIRPSDPDSITDENPPVILAWNALRCLQDGAKRHKRGVDVLRGCYPLVENVPVEFDGPTVPDVLWKDGGFALRKSVGVQRSRTMRTRPIFTDWQFALPVEVDPNIWDLDTLRNVWRDAGVYAGLGEMRPVYGRFIATIEEV